ncbi:Uu.00g138620.m01.CDS01 [Anthostomella pinea]|uniref:Uu.00g138620.m01.CDS01 n=1 Tax=Anthostomella pinea TaxID=933095 RepID=A0AAI8YIT4_9PEZI|nr:Uu.00g138620.m01.CDS01 [Anthostomella pinea]
MSADEARWVFEPGYASDIWALACSLVALRIGCPFFGDKDPSYIWSLDMTLGPLPHPYRGAFLEHLRKAREEEGEEVLANWGDHVRDDGTLMYVRPPSGYYQELKYERFLAERTEFSQPILARLAMKQEFHPYPHRPNAKPVTFNVLDEEVKQLGELLQRIFKYDSKERFTIDDVLNHQWFKDLSLSTEKQTPSVI